MRALLPLLLIFIAALNASAQPTPAPERLLDAMDDPASWQIAAPDGVLFKVRSVPGKAGPCLRLDYDFSKAAGTVALIRKPLRVPLPANYVFSFWAKFEGLPAADSRLTIDFRLADESHTSVRSLTRPEIDIPRTWSRWTCPSRTLSDTPRPLQEAHWVELAVTSPTGAKGALLLDELSLQPLPDPAPEPGPASLTASSGLLKSPSLPPSGAIGWTSARDDATPTLTLDFGPPRSFGGIIIEWGQSRPADCEIESSPDGITWSSLAHVHDPGRRVYLQTPDVFTPRLRIRCADSGPRSEIVIDTLRIMPPEFGDSRNQLMKTVADEHSRGWFPRYFTGQASYCTAVGAPGDDHEALLREDGVVEVDRLGFTIEPFLLIGKNFGTWVEFRHECTLEPGGLPIPSARRVWERAAISVEVEAFADGSERIDPASPHLFLRYHLRNTGSSPSQGSLFLAIRPLQATPPFPASGAVGGVADIRSIDGSTGFIRVDRRWVIPIVPPAAFGATTFDSGEIVRSIAEGVLPALKQVDDPRSLASAALRYDYSLKAGESLILGLVVPFNAPEAALAAKVRAGEGMKELDARLESVRQRWRNALNTAAITFPHPLERLNDAIRAQQGWLLVNNDGPAPKPGPRLDPRTCMRQIALASPALLAFAHAEQVRDTLDWFAAFQPADGRMPCCVLAGHPIPSPEYDSLGQYLYAVRTYFEFTRDEVFLRRHWNRVVKTIDAVEALRAPQTTEAVRAAAPRDRAAFGLMPASAGHESYGPDPVHAYLDNFWTLRGLSDAVRIATALGESASARRFAALRDAFRQSLVDSITLTLQTRAIDFIPGCPELGDLDAPGIAEAVWPCGLASVLPRIALENALDRYLTKFNDRRDGGTVWRECSTRELRTLSAMIALGRRELASQMLGFFLQSQRPTGWCSWGDSFSREPRELVDTGDTPSALAAADMLNAVLLMIALPREGGSDGAGADDPAHDSIVIGAGLSREWITPPPGLSVRALRTPAGQLTFSVTSTQPKDSDQTTLTYTIESLERSPAGGVYLSLPDTQMLARVLVTPAPVPGKPDPGAQEMTPDEHGLIRLPGVPVTVEAVYRVK